MNNFISYCNFALAMVIEYEFPDVVVFDVQETARFIRPHTKHGYAAMLKQCEIKEFFKKHSKDTNKCKVLYVLEKDTRDEDLLEALSLCKINDVVIKRTTPPKELNCNIHDLKNPDGFFDDKKIQWWFWSLYSTGWMGYKKTQ